MRYIINSDGRSRSPIKIVGTRMLQFKSRFPLSKYTLIRMRSTLRPFDIEWSMTRLFEHVL